MTQVILCSIVKNEEKILMRMVNSARAHAHILGAVICDTGSIDSTPELVCQEAYKCVKIPWEGYGPSRTRALQETREFARHHVDLARTYALLLDADHELVAPIDYKKIQDTGYARAYYLHQRDRDLTYNNIRLIRLDTHVTCVGRTHEYWAVECKHALDTVHAPVILDHTDGNNRTEKYERDIALLNSDIEENPRNPRSWFYLGQTFENRNKDGDRIRAIRAYERHQELGSFAAEIWVSKYRLGKLYLQSDLPSEQALGVALLFTAHGLRPQRREAYLAIAQYFLNTGKHALAIEYAERAQDIPHNPQENFFIENSAYTVGPGLILAQAFFYLGLIEKGRRACETLLEIPYQSQDFYSHVLYLLTWYLKPIHAEKTTVFIQDISQRFSDGRIQYNSSSPTFIDNDHTCVRMVNYDQTRGRWYEARHDDKVIRTQNLLVHKNETMPLVEPENIRCVKNTQIQGIEDIRVGGPLSKDHNIKFTATCCQFPESLNKPQVGIGTLDLNNVTISDFKFLEYEKSKEYEKNWILVQWDWEQETGYLVYSWDPFVVLSVNKSGKCTEVLRSIQQWSGLRFRGGTQAVQLPDSNNTYLTLIHEVAHREIEGKIHRIYLHRLVYFTLTTGILTYSDAFIFEHLGIEYATGLRLVNEYLVIGYSVEDCSTKEFHIPLTDLSKFMAMPHTHAIGQRFETISG